MRGMSIKMSRKATALIAILLSLGLTAKVVADPKQPVPRPKPTPKLDLGGVKGESTDDKHKDTISRQSNSPTPKPSTPPKSKSLDSHSELSADPHFKEAIHLSMQLRDGANLVQSRDGVKLTALSRSNSVTGWTATDEAGHKLPTKVQERSTSAGPEQVITIEDKAHHRVLETVVTTEDRSARKIRFKPFVITKKIDKASP
ncbi:MAG: hypothetical protein QOH88_1433 [Verrucomicrobiota bacterium]|jgi:hypothetical protein